MIARIVFFLVIFLLVINMVLSISKVQDLDELPAKRKSALHNLVRYLVIAVDDRMFCSYSIYSYVLQQFTYTACKR